MNHVSSQPNIRLIAASLLLCIVCFGFFISTASAAETNSTLSGVESIAVYHFHPTNGCVSCTTMGDYAEETVKTYFPRELETKKITFDHINYQDPKNADLVKQYNVTGSALMIGVTDASGLHTEENIKVWYKIGNKEEYMTYLKDLLEKRFTGSFEE
jgi:hypothetical protein